MATASFVSKRLTLRLQTGLDDDFAPIYSNRNYSNVRESISDADLLTLGTKMGDLTEHQLSDVTYTEQTLLESQ